MTFADDLVDPAEVGMSADRLRFADALMERQFADGRSPMLAAIVARRGQVVFTKTLGDHRPGGPPLTLDSVFPLASNGKPMTAATLLAVAERGLMGLTEPVVTYLPELEVNDNAQVLIHHLLTHTSGWDGPALDAAMVAGLAAGVGDAPPGVDFLSHLFLTTGWAVPRSRPAGELMQYNNFNYTLIGEIIRRATGGTLDAAMREYLFEPVGMVDSAVIVSDELLPRVVERPEGMLYAPGHPDTVLPHFHPLFLGFDDGGGGVHATPVDNFRFLEMIRNGGMVGSHRVLSCDSVRAMTTNQIPDVPAKMEGLELKEASWGYGFGVGGADPIAYFRGGTASRGSLRHAGAGGIGCWVDPTLAITGVYYELVTEEDKFGFAKSSAFDLFEDVVTAAVVD